MGAVLQQLLNADSEPLGFFSKKFSSTEKKYAANDHELLA